MFHVPEKHRIIEGRLASNKSYGNNGAFMIPIMPKVMAFVIASDGSGWEHVSVHIIDDGQDATPLWEEMCDIKDLFWDNEDTVIQFHPPLSEYVNNHKNTLHMWRPIGVKIPRPATELVRIK